MEELKELKERMEAQRPADWDSLPDLNLYMDQVIGYMPRQLIQYGEEERLTSAMVNIRDFAMRDYLAQRLGVEPQWGARNAVLYEIGTYASFATRTLLNHLPAVEFRAAAGGEEVPVTVNIPGGFTVYNALCVLGCARALHIPLTAAAEALARALAELIRRTADRPDAERPS